MKKILFLVISIVLGSFSSYATTTYTVGTTGTHTTILSAYNDCTNPDDYIIEIQSDYNFATAGESGGIALTGKANKDAVNTITIRPASGVTLSFSSNSNQYIFRLYGAQWVIFDGRAGGVGSSAWTLLNTNNGAGSRVFTFENGANNVVIKNCQIKGDNGGTGSTTAGLIYFGGTSSTAGNIDNLIENCTFSEHIGFLKIYIHSAGAATTKRNKNNTISNCSFVNFRTSAINISSNSEAYTISNNHFYRTSTSTPQESSTAIVISNSGYTGHVISGNYMGGKHPIAVVVHIRLATQLIISEEYMLYLVVLEQTQ